MGRGADGSPLPPDETVFYEIQFHDPLGRPTERRKFSASGPPGYAPATAQWSINLVRSYDGRDRAGAAR